jgi:hypothetical protein
LNFNRGHLLVLLDGELSLKAALVAMRHLAAKIGWLELRFAKIAL